MNKCPRCATDNAPNIQFCSRCGLQFAAPVVKPKTNSWTVILIVAGFLFGSCIICGIIATIVDKQKPKPEIVTTTEPTPKQSKQVAPTVAKTETPKSGVTIENFNKIKTGMSYRQIVEILGSEGEVLSENEIAGTKTVMYQWQGGFMANMNAMFQNDKLISKAQFGLK